MTSSTKKVIKSFPPVWPAGQAKVGIQWMNSIGLSNNAQVKGILILISTPLSEFISSEN